MFIAQMVLHYAKRCHTLLEKLGFRSVYVAIDVQDAQITWLNTNITFEIDDIVQATWTNHRHVKLHVLYNRTSYMSFEFQFDSDTDLDVFLSDIGMDAESSCVQGSGRRGSFTNRRKSGLLHYLIRT